MVDGNTCKGWTAVRDGPFTPIRGKVMRMENKPAGAPRYLTGEGITIAQISWNWGSRQFRLFMQNGTQWHCGGSARSRTTIRKKPRKRQSYLPCDRPIHISDRRRGEIAELWLGANALFAAGIDQFIAPPAFHVERPHRSAKKRLVLWNCNLCFLRLLPPRKSKSNEQNHLTSLALFNTLPRRY